MGIATIFAQISCSDIENSVTWYTKLFGKPPIRRPMFGLAEWQFTESAEVQVYEQREHAGHAAELQAKNEEWQLVCANVFGLQGSQ
jgi:hypothetical protein